jgi:hypothetical protein
MRSLLFAALALVGTVSAVCDRRCYLDNCNLASVNTVEKYLNCIADCGCTKEFGYGLLSTNLADTIGCFEDALSRDECQDLFQVALKSGVVPDKDIMRNIYGSHKDTMQALLSNMAHRRELSLYGNSSNSTGGWRDLLNVRISVNESAFEEFINDFYNLQMEYEALRQQKAIQQREFIQDKYAETLAKVYLEFGKTVAPVVEAYARTLRDDWPDSDCNTDCLLEKCYLQKINQRTYQEW